jgi:hypothetical protein
MTRSFWQTLFRRPDNRSRPAASRARRPFRPTLLVLEDRTVPSTLTVTSAADSGPGTLRQTIQDAAGGDTIVFDDSLSGQTITLTSDSLTVGKDLTIAGPGSDQLAIDGNLQHTIFNTSANVLISGLAITDSSPAAVNNTGKAELDNCVLTGNHSGTGGAVFNDGNGTMTLNGCLVSNNTAGNAGGIENQGQQMTIINSQVVNNTANLFGGGVINWSHLDVIDSLIAGNSAQTYDGGGIYNANGVVTVTESTLDGNTAGGYGGGFFNGAALTLARSTLSNNTAGNSGGGLAVYSPNATAITNSTVANNTALGTTQSSGGGGIALINLAHVTVESSTIAGNSAATNGGGVYNTLNATALTLHNSIVANNAAGNVGNDVAGAVTSRGYNLIGQTDGSSGWVDSDLTGTSASPLDPMLGPLQDNGGPTQTMALLGGSPAIGAGDPLDAPAVDQRGVARNSPPSIGAFEFTGG